MQLNDFFTQHNIDDGHQGYFVRPTLQDCYEDLLSGCLNRPGQMMAIYLFHHFATRGDRLKFAVLCACEERTSAIYITELYKELRDELCGQVQHWKSCVDELANDIEQASGGPTTRLSLEIDYVNALPVKLLNANAINFCYLLEFAFKGDVLRVMSMIIGKFGYDTDVLNESIGKLKDFTVNFNGVPLPDEYAQIYLQYNIPALETT